jgi:hypothetical protein
MISFSTLVVNTNIEQKSSQVEPCGAPDNTENGEESCERRKIH